jgi:ubiquinone/menaquinone biosynthesis C-methylase UbiE
VLETRGADPQQQALRHAFLETITFPANAQVLEVGCGAGVLTRRLAQWPTVGAVVGVDPAPALLLRARERATGLPNASCQEADGRSLSFAVATFDVVVFDSALCHMPEPERALAAALRVLRAQG